MALERLDVARNATREGYEAIMLSETLVAQHPGKCAICFGKIVPNRSKIVAVAPRLPSEGVFFDRGPGPSQDFRDSSTGDGVLLRKRTWAHLKCAEALEPVE